MSEPREDKLVFLVSITTETFTLVEGYTGEEAMSSGLAGEGVDITWPGTEDTEDLRVTVEEVWDTKEQAFNTLAERNSRPAFYSEQQAREWGQPYTPPAERGCDDDPSLERGQAAG